MTLIKYIDTFIPTYLFPLSTVSILRAEILSPASFSLQYQALRRCFNEYLLNRGMTIRHLENRAANGRTATKSENVRAEWGLKYH